jgi:SAM-dependent methyltransferase
MLPYVNEVMLDLAILNPLLPDTVRQFGKVMDLRPGQTVLELACGKAGVSLPMAYVYKVRLTGVDLMPDYIGEAWSRAEYSGLAELCNFRTEDAVTFVDQARGQWDAVLVLGALSLIWPGIENGLEKVKPLVKPGGYLIIGEPYRRPDREIHPDVPHTEEEITEIMNKFGTVINIFDDGEPGWQAYLDPQKKIVERLKEDHSDNQELTEFLDWWIQRIGWEKNNIGFAAWLIKVEA